MEKGIDYKQEQSAENEEQLRQEEGRGVERGY